MKNGKLILVLGGTRSGKSSFAEKLAQGLSERVLYLATATVHDEEMALRVNQHQERRPVNWFTVEEAKELATVLEKYSKAYDVILIDCLALWLSNLLLDDTKHPDTHWREKEALILQEVEKLAGICRDSSANVIIVSSEVGLGIVPDTSLGRQFRDLAGAANQTFAQYANEVYMVIAGLPIELKALALPIE